MKSITRSLILVWLLVVSALSALPPTSFEAAALAAPREPHAQSAPVELQAQSAPVEPQAQSAPQALLLNVEGPVAPTMLQYIRRGIRTAERRNMDLLILRLNTPGGYISSMTSIVEAMLASDVPILVYVAPSGGMAASAGTMITLAGQVAAMAPSTIIGAASPIDVSGNDLTSTAEAKEKEALRALVRTLTARRPPDAISLAEDTIDKARAVTVDEALNIGLIDFMANDLNDLLNQINGYEVTVGHRTYALVTTDMHVDTLALSFPEQLLNILANPNILFVLIVIGIQAILIEMSSPGGWVAGFIGVTCLALATYGMGILPVNWFGLAFILIAFVLFVLDIKAPTHGALTVAGTASLIAGALVLFDIPEMPGLPSISPWFVGAISIATAAGFAFMLSFALRAMKAPVRTGQVRLPGKEGVVRSDLNPRGTVQVGGELWTAERVGADEPIPAGTRVQVVRVEGMTVFVKKAGA